MAEEGTAAVLERDDAVTEADTAVEETPETVAEETPESETSETSPDSDDSEEEEPETLTREEHEKALKAATAKLEESYRRKQEDAVAKANDAAYKQQLQQAEAVVGGWAYQQMAGLTKEIAGVLRDGNEINEQELAKRVSSIAYGMNQSHALRETDAHYKVFLKKLGDFKPDAEQVSAYERALASRNPQSAHDALMTLLEARADAKAETKYKALQKQAAETAKLSDGVKAAKATQRPTSGTPASPAKGYTLAQLDAMPTSEWNAIGASDKDGGDQRRKDILNRAHEMAAKK